jgi:hypothetical protein
MGISEHYREALRDAIKAARLFNRSGMTWQEYDAELVRLERIADADHPTGAVDPPAPWDDSLTYAIACELAMMFNEKPEPWHDTAEAVARVARDHLRGAV